MYKWISLLALVTTCGALSLRDAGPCFPKDCVPPACVCSSEKIPYAGWDVKDTPQMILLVFEGSINDVTYSTYYKPLFEGVTNPNGCPASGTFFVSHKYTDYSLVNDIWTTGSDIAPQSIT